MVTIQEAKKQVREAKEKIGLAKQKLAEQKSQISRAETQLTKVKQALPNVTSARALRKYQGLKGRLIRRQVMKTGEIVSSKLKSIKEGKELLKKYEGNLQSYEEKVKAYESQISKIERERQAFERAQEFYYRGVPLVYVKGMPEYKYLKEFYEQKKLATKSFIKKIKEFEEKNPSEKLIVDYKNLRVKGIESGALGGTFDVEEYNKKIKEFNRDIAKIKEIDTSKLDRISKMELDKLNRISSDIKSSKFFTGGLIPLVSATGGITGAAISQRDINKMVAIPERKGIVTSFGTIRKIYPSGQGTAEITPLTPEQAKIFQKGTFEGTIKSGAELVKRIAIAGEKTFRKSVDVLEDVSRGVSKIAGFVGEQRVQVLPSYIQKPLGVRDVKLGEVILFGREALRDIGKYGERKVMEIPDLLGIKTERVIKQREIPVYLHETIMDKGITPTRIKAPPIKQLTPTGFAFKTISKAVRYAPETIAYISQPEAMLGVDILAGSEKIKKIDKLYKEELKKQYQANVERLKKEGLKENERIPTLKEFEQQVGSEIRRNLERNILIGEVGVPLLFIGAGVTGKVIRKITKPKIEYQPLDIKMKDSKVSVIEKPLFMAMGKDKRVVFYPDVKVSSLISKKGRKTITKDWLGRTIYEGVPYGKVGREQYQKALKYLMKKGYTESQARNVLRLYQPRLEKEAFRGGILLVSGDEGSLAYVKGISKRTPLFTKVRGVKTRGGGEFGEIVDTYVVPIKGDSDLIKFVEEAKKFFVSKEGLPYSKIFQAGKTTTTFAGVGAVKKIGETELAKKGISLGGFKISPTETYEIYKDITAAKQIIPSKRAVSFGKGITLISKKPPQFIFDISGVSGEFAGKTMGVGKKSSQQFFQQLYSTKEAAEKISTALKKITKVKPVTSLKMTGEAVLKAEQRGIFPVVSAVSPKEKIKTEQVTTIKTKEIQKQKEIARVKPIEKTLLKTRQILKPELGLKVKQVLKAKQLETPIQAPTQKQVSKQRSVLRALLGLRQKQVQKIKEIVSQEKSRARPRPKPVIETTIKPKPRKEFKFGEPEPKKKTALDVFKAFVRKKGKDVLLGEFETLEEAKRRLKKELLTTLRAGGYITRGGKKQRIDLGFGFRPSKIDPFRVVQKKTLRFGTTGEVKEAQFFRKTKRRKIKFI